MMWLFHVHHRLQAADALRGFLAFAVLAGPRRSFEPGVFFRAPRTPFLKKSAQRSIRSPEMIFFSSASVGGFGSCAEAEGITGSEAAGNVSG